MSKQPSILPPFLVLCLVALVVPASLPLPTAGFTSEDCLRLAEKRPEPGPGVLALLERCSAMYPQDVELLGDLAWAYESANVTARAEATYIRALELDPDYADLRLRLGRLLLRRGDAAEARRQADRALLVQPNRLALLELKKAADEAQSGMLR